MSDLVNDGNDLRMTRNGGRTETHLHFYNLCNLQTFHQIRILFMYVETNAKHPFQPVSLQMQI
jgi:hypothetical protein